jgi:hypothetical protein
MFASPRTKFLLLTAFFVSACDGGHSSNQVSSPIEASNGADTLVVDQADKDIKASERRKAHSTIYAAELASSIGVPEALQSGKLQIRGGCLVVNSGGQIALAILPQGSTYDASQQIVRHGTQKIKLETPISFGGGSYPAGHEVFLKLRSSAPTTCPKNGMLIGELL